MEKRKISEIDSFVELLDRLFSRPINNYSTRELKEFRSTTWKLSKEYKTEQIFSMISIELSQRDTSNKFIISLGISLVSLFLSICFR